MNPSTVYCDTCGAANRPTARFCIACGQAMAAVSSLPPTVQVGAAASPPTPPLVQATPPPTSPSLTGLLPSNSLLKGRYLILSRLGKGGMGAVYKAADTQLGDRLVAVKEMSQKGLDLQELTEATTSFKREALMLAGLFQRNLPRIYDHFEESGRWYLVMDFIAGETLEEQLAKVGGTLPVEEVLDIGIQLCTVLSYLHNHQPPIIFRDLKPANVMRTLDGDLFLIDFGIARHFKAGQAKDTIAYGSAGYAPPEQYGKAQTTPQSDIYSLGATLHHLLSGNDPSSNMPTLFDFPPVHLLGQSPGLEPLIMRMVEKVASNRPASMDEVKQELQQLATQPAASQPPQTPSQLPPTVYVGSSSLPPTQLAANPPLPQQPSVASPLPPPQVARISPRLGTTLYTYRGHSDEVHTVAWSPDGRRIASGSADKTVQVWDVAEGVNIYTYRGHSKPVLAVAWSPDGRRIASGSADKTVQVWDAATGKTLYTYSGHSTWLISVASVAWSPDGMHITSSSSSFGFGGMQIWDADTGRSLAGYEFSEGVNAVAWSPDGRRIASGSDDYTVQVWDAATGKPLLTYRDHRGRVNAVAWSPDSSLIASGSNLKDVQVWDAATGKTRLTYLHSGWTPFVLAVAWSPDGSLIASGSSDKLVEVWDAATGKIFYIYRDHVKKVNAVAWSPDGTRIASGSADKTVQVWVAE